MHKPIQGAKFTEFLVAVEYLAIMKTLTQANREAVVKSREAIETSYDLLRRILDGDLA